jgi:hypothetical protein
MAQQTLNILVTLDMEEVKADGPWWQVFPAEMASNSRVDVRGIQSSGVNVIQELQRAAKG